MFYFPSSEHSAQGAYLRQMEPYQNLTRTLRRDPPPYTTFFTMASKGIWSNFSKRAPSLGIKNPKLKEALLSANLPDGPVTLRRRANKIKYSSPVGLEDVYPLAYDILQKEANECYKSLETTTSKKKVESLLTSAEKYNPEVLFQAHYNTNSLDLTQPVFRHYLKEKWMSFDLMLLMQRLETLHVIPDTLPTLDPKVDVKLKFPHNNVETWIEPGKILSSNATSRPPTLKVTEFEKIDKQLYTVLVVNPDVPDLKKDSFSTFLHWGVKDVELSNVDNEISAKKLMDNKGSEFCDYIPPTPEKNAPANRLAVWVFRQNGEPLKEVGDIKRLGFDIREFVSSCKLTPVGAHVWRSRWDRNVRKVREMYGLPEGRVFHRVRR